MHPTVYWFRDDLRLHDNPALAAACAQAVRLVPVWVMPPAQSTDWGFDRFGERRQAFRASAVRALDHALRMRGSRLLVLHGEPVEVLSQLLRRLDATHLYCEEIATPEECEQLDGLRSRGISVHSTWQSTLFDPSALPWHAEGLPDVFSRFRLKLEAARIEPMRPVPEPDIPPLPEDLDDSAYSPLPDRCAIQPDSRSSFPFPLGPFQAGERIALAHLEQYLARGLPHRYLSTRNELRGVDFSGKFSPWLACGALSPRFLIHALAAFEARCGASESSAWLKFELLWRDYFRLLHLKYGRRLYRARGLSERAVDRHDPTAFLRWRSGHTGQSLVDAGMRELACTGYLSNRMRQIVASYLVHDLNGDWRAGAAWFEHALIDYDCYSNLGNWLYIAGRGTDPRGGRRFNPDKQAALYDADGLYRAIWSEPSRSEACATIAPVSQTAFRSSSNAA